MKTPCVRLSIEVFLSTLSLRRATADTGKHLKVIKIFLSTLSLRRATIVGGAGNNAINISIHALLAESDKPTKIGPNLVNNFYPRSPCGERPSLNQLYINRTAISIHALLAESDNRNITNCERQKDISIHALLAESDDMCHYRNCE